MIVGAMIIGAIIVGAMIVGEMIVGTIIVEAVTVGAMRRPRWLQLCSGKAFTLLLTCYLHVHRLVAGADPGREEREGRGFEDFLVYLSQFTGQYATRPSPGSAHDPGNIKHLYKIYTILDQRCINVIKMFCVCWLSGSRIETAVYTIIHMTATCL